MCGRFTQTKSQQSAINRFVVKVVSEEVERLNRPRYNIAPSQDVPIIMSRNQSPDTREMNIARWGLIPRWAKESKMKVNTINARSERVEESPVYRQSFMQRRCVVPVSGYYEWKAGTSPKQPYFIYASEREEWLALAGLWDCWKAPDGTQIESFTIMTTEANEKINTVHHRMPVLLVDEESLALWLGEVPSNSTQLKKMMEPSRPELLEFHPVSPQMNKVSNDSELNVQVYEPLEWDF